MVVTYKLEKMLFRIVTKLSRIHVAKNNIFNMKQNCCSNILWSRSKLPAGKNLQSNCVLYESRSLYGTSSDDTKKNIIKNDDKVLVYYGLLTSKIKTLKVVSYTTSLIGLLVQPIIYERVISLGAPAIMCLFAIMGFSTFVTPILIHIFTKKYITEIKYDPSCDVYISKTLTFFLREKIMTFKPEEVKYNSSASLFNSLIIKGKSYMLFQEGILVKEHYIKLLGFDKPVDLKIEEDDPVQTETSSIKSVVHK